MRAFVSKGLVVALTLAGATGCMFDHPTPPTPRLDGKETSALFKCQMQILKGGQKLSTARHKALEQCLAAGFKLQFPTENGLVEPAEYGGEFDKVHAKCASSFAKVTKASSKFVDAVVKKCTPVASSVLGSYDALRFQALAFGDEDDTFVSIEALAGALCGAHGQLTDLSVFIQAPRLLEILHRLDPAFVDLDSGDGGSPMIPLDPRCESQPLPTSL